MISIGDKVTFQPHAFLTEGALTQCSKAPTTVTGRVEYINHAHDWYRVRVEFEGGAVLHECFKIY